MKTERQAKWLTTVSLDLSIGDNGSELADVVANPNAEKPGAAAVSQAGFEARIAPLGARHQALLRAVYCQDQGLSVVGTAWGISRARVSVLHMEALKELKRRGGHG